MKILKLMTAAIGGIALSASAYGQSCTTFKTPVQIEIGEDADGGLDPALACVAVGGQVYWLGDDGDTTSVTFATTSPLDSSNLTPATDGTFYKVLSSPGTYSYTATYVDRSGGSHTVSGTVMLGNPVRATRTNLAAPKTSCTKKTHRKSKLITLTVDAQKLTLLDNDGGVDSVCMKDPSHVAWVADGSIKAWALVFRDQKTVPTTDPASWSAAEKNRWYKVTCPDCKPGELTIRHHKYYVLAIGTNGKVYRTDPDIIVVPDIIIRHR